MYILFKTIPYTSGCLEVSFLISFKSINEQSTTENEQTTMPDSNV